MSEFQPVCAVADLDTLDSAEVVEGYFDGRANEPEPGNNRSRSYWHGWRNGMVDAGHREGDDAQGRLAHEAITSGYFARLTSPSKGEVGR